MWRRNAPRLTSTLVAFAFSLIAHWLMFLHLSVGTQPPPAPTSPIAPQAVPLLSEEQVRAALKRHPKPTAPQPPKPKPKPKPKQEATGQVVEIPPPPEERVPEHARFRSEFNSAVEREQVSAVRAPPTPEMRRSEREALSGGKDERGTREGKRDARSEPAPQTPARPLKPQEGDATRQESTPTKARPDPRSGERPGAPPPARRRERPSLKEVRRGEGPFASQERAAEPAPPTPSTPDPRPQGSGGGGRLGGNLTPTHYQGLLPTLGPQDAARSDGSIDHVDVPEGDSTALNTREYKYAHFFNRVKREVAARWFAVEALRDRDPRGNVYGVKDRHTVLAVTLYPNGSIARLEVAQESGLPFLDAEAVSSFERAQPFHNPPPGLADPDGMIRFNFGFFLEIGGRGFRFLP